MLALLQFFLPILVSGGELHCGSSICPVISANLEAILVSSILRVAEVARAALAEKFGVGRKF